MISRWIQWKSKQLLTEKAHKMFMMYKYFSDLQIFIDDSYNIFWRLYDLLWTWQKKSWSFYEMLHVNMCSIIWKNDSQLFVSEEYYNLIDVFKRQNADKLSSHWKEYNIRIKLKLKKNLNFDFLYSMSQKKLQILWQYLNKHFTKNFI